MVELYFTNNFDNHAVTTQEIGAINFIQTTMIAGNGSIIMWLSNLVSISYIQTQNIKKWRDQIW